MPKISIVIPCYNVEKYLKQCLDSVVNQTLQDIEIICINDGSTDSTLSILREYENSDNRIKVISKHNSGYGASMNIGLETAKGKYIGIVESDDYAELNMFETLYNVAEENNLDLVRCQYYLYNSKENSNDPWDNSWVPMGKVYKPLLEQKPFGQAPAIWSNLVNREFLNKNNIRFLETPGASYQDSSFAFKLYACADRFMMIPDRLLHYRIDNENSSVNSSAKANFVNTEYAEITRFSKEKGIYKDVCKLIPKLKYACYQWNHFRLSEKLKPLFIFRWSSEFRKHFFAGEIDKKLFTKKEYKRILFLVFLPIFYIFRKEL